MKAFLIVTNIIQENKVSNRMKCFNHYTLEIGTLYTKTSCFLFRVYRYIHELKVIKHDTRNFLNFQLITNYKKKSLIKYSSNLKTEKFCSLSVHYWKVFILRLGFIFQKFFHQNFYRWVIFALLTILVQV